MSMTPQERQEFNEIKKRLVALERVENVPFVENMTRRLADSFNIPEVLNDLTDVNVPSPSSGQVLEWNGSAWVAATDNV